jgi:chromosome segregation ATPase
MSIEWDKIESKPGKGYKVQGEDLLALRQNLFSLEKDVATLKNERDDLNANIDSLKKNISDLEEQVRQKDNKISSLETDLKQADEAISKSQGRDECTNSTIEQGKRSSKGDYSAANGLASLRSGEYDQQLEQSN